jgi:hypothetical protein
MMSMIDTAQATDKQRDALVKLRAYGSTSAIPDKLTKSEASKQIDEALARDSYGSDRLSLATLLSRDPNGGRGSANGKHYLCPFEACRDHQEARKHRSLSVADSGQYLCHRCKSKGVLSGTQSKQSQASSYDPRIERLHKEAQDCFKPTLDPERQAVLDKMVSECVPIARTPGEEYLAKRGIVTSCASDSGVLFSPSWYGMGAAVIFLSLDERGKIIGAQGRYIDPSISPKMRGAGRTSVGTFRTHGAFEAGNMVVAITEAPIDALSIYGISGVPSVALFGVNVPIWLRRRCSMKHVLIATDSDDAGELCAARLSKELNLSISVQRLVFPNGSKDANEALAVDATVLGATIRDLTKRIL